MKKLHLIPLVLLGLALSAEPAMAQSRGGGGSSSRSSSSSSHSSYSGGSRSSSSYSGGSSHSSSSYSSPSRSSSSYSSPSRSSSSYSSPSRSTSTSPSRSGSYSSPSRTSAPGSTGYSPSRTSAPGPGGRTLSTPGTTRGAMQQGRPSSSSTQRSSTPRPGQGTHAPAPKDGRTGTPAHMGPASQGAEPLRPGAAPRPGGHMPPSARPMHPVFHHPIHHGHCHVHICPWDACIYHPWHWPGFWLYCNTYWYDYHCTDVVVVREYVQQTYHTQLITYAMSGDLMYALVEGPDGQTYLQVYDREDKVLAEQRVSSKYVKMEIDRENGGCWILKKKDKDPMLFLYQDGKLLIYEAE